MQVALRRSDCGSVSVRPIPACSSKTNASEIVNSTFDGGGSPALEIQPISRVYVAVRPSLGSWNRQPSPPWSVTVQVTAQVFVRTLRQETYRLAVGVGAT